MSPIDAVDAHMSLSVGWPRCRSDDDQHPLAVADRPSCAAWVERAPQPPVRPCPTPAGQAATMTLSTPCALQGAGRSTSFVAVDGR